ncbi:MAG: hypothetical protein ABIS50_20755 [Luteolibacter sp.]|uniref:Ig-like domain-containing protein n=1 Tax=Luteolibacter sp. TaxID=1962973 RepID=UPI003263C71E
MNGAVAKSGKGTSWKDAYKYLRDALDHSSPEDVIYLAKGTYYPDDGKSGSFGDREMSFELDGQKIYGGFVGKETSLSQRNPKANPTILSGEIWNLGGEDVYWSLHVAVLSRDSTLDGLTVEDGHASGSDSWAYPSIPHYDEGGGCYVKAGKTLTLSNCTFRNNHALSFGGAIMVEDDTGKVVASDCVFDSNKILLDYDITLADSGGGAIKGNVEATRCEFTFNEVVAENFIGGTTSFARGGAVSGNVTATKCEFTGNTVTAYGVGPDVVTATAIGGAVFGDVTAVQCDFSANGATAESSKTISSGGAVGGGSLIAENCSFSENHSGFGLFDDKNGTGKGGGGAVNVSSGQSILANCVFVKNTSQMRGGAVHGDSEKFADSLVVANCTFLDNGVVTGLDGAALSCGGIVRMLNNIFWYNSANTVDFTRDNLINVIYKGVLRNSMVDYPTPSTITPNIVRGGSAGVRNAGGGDIFLGAVAQTILAGDPLFINAADPDGADNIWRTTDDGLQVGLGSPAIGILRDPRVKNPKNFLPKDSLDIDKDDDFTEFLPIDMIGVVRVQKSFVDMGAYEFGNRANVPEISVFVNNANPLTDGDTISFGTVTQGSPLQKTIIVKNVGTSGLKDLSFSLKGSLTFTLKSPFTNYLKPGASAKLIVTFRPTGKSNEAAKLQIVSTDDDESSFDITLRGSGISKTNSTAKPNFAAEAPLVFPVVAASPTGQGRTSAVVTTATDAKGVKYLVLTVSKATGSNVEASNVEVSSNLLDWYSGSNHTTTLAETPTILSVRDNTPVVQGAKRYIRLK